MDGFTETVAETVGVNVYPETDVLTVYQTVSHLLRLMASLSINLFFMPEVSSFFFHQFINSQDLQILSTRAFQGLLSDDKVLK